jgi:steroid 5-alpha reductase family enzyme
MIPLTLSIVLLFIYLISIVIFIQLKKDNSIGNFTWGGGCIIASIYTLLITSTFLSRQLLATALIVIWGTRLIFYLISRYKKGADPRFVSWQIEKGNLKALIITIGWIFIAQGALLLVMISPIVAINISIVPGITILDIFATFAWCIGFCIETISDYQLYQFLKDPSHKGKVMKYGLWHYSRHPNYFGESIMWWSFYLIALHVPYGWATIIAPITITIILRFFSIPLLEHTFEQNPEYQEFNNNTSIFVPKFR